MPFGMFNKAPSYTSKPREIRNHYPIRVIGYILVFVENVIIYHDDPWFTPWMWLALGAFTFIHPHAVFYLTNDRKRELYNFTFEYLLLSLYIVLWGYNELLILSILSVVVLTSVSAGGIRALGYSLLLMALFVSVYSLLIDRGYRESLSMTSKIYAVIATLMYFFLIGYVFNTVNRSLNKAKKGLSRQREELLNINELASTVNSTLDIDSLMMTVLKSMRKTYRMEMMFITSFTEDKKYVEIIGTYGDNLPEESKTQLQQVKLPVDKEIKSIFVEQLIKDKVLYDRDMKNHMQRNQSRIDQLLYKHYPLKSFVYFPISVDGEVIAGIAFFNSEKELILNDKDIDRISSYMLQVGSAIKNIQLFEKANKEKIKAEESEKAKGSFLANMSHEIRTPMTAILGYSEALQDESISLKERKEFTHTIIQGGRHLLSIINDILDISKIEADKIEVEMLDVSLPLLIKELDSSIKLKAEEKGLEYKLDINFPIPFDVRIDPTRIKQVLFNLASNAIKFTEKGSITVKVQWDKNGALTLSIKDTGIGLSEEEKGRLFQAFSQADTSTTRVYGGTGLGLYISKNLVQLMGGDLWVESEKGRGSEFIVKIDMLHDFTDACIQTQLELDQCLQVLQGEEAVEHIPSLEGRVLVAEDTLENQKLIRHLIEKTGLEVTLVENGQLALEQTKMESYDLIMLDMQMPIMGGLEAAERIQAQGIFTPRIAFTANVMKHQLDEYKNKQFDDVVEKPIVREKLYTILEKYFAPKIQLDRLLIVDDNAVNRMVLARYISKLMPAVHVDHADNGEKALAQVKSRTYDLIFMDMEMPVMGGLEATEMIRELGFEMPIYMATGNVDKRYVEQGKDAGADGHIIKPIDRGQLEKVLRQFM